MATRGDIQGIIAYMKSSFPNYHPELDGEINTVDVLFDQLGDMDTDTLRMAVRAACMPGTGRQFAPSSDEIRVAITNLHAQAAGVPTTAEAWGAIMESFNRTSFHQPTLLDNPLVKEAIRCMGGLSVIGMSENLPAERARFLQFYDELRQRALSDVAMLPAITEYIESKRMIDGSIKTLAERLSHPQLEDKPYVSAETGNGRPTNFIQE